MKAILKNIFIGPNGIRAGWRIAIFIAISSTILGLFFLALHVVHNLTHLSFEPSKTTLTPLSAVTEIAFFASLIASAYIMSRIEQRPFASYGLPWRGIRQQKLWGGLVAGFVAISCALFAIFAFHGFEITGISTGGSALLVSVLLWSPTFLLVGLSEEFMFRGYLQYTLASGLGRNGFMWAALILSLGFGAVHTHNAGETPVGIAQVVVFGLLMCLVLRLTGSLWLGIGFHAGWDWGESFFYGVPDSGLATWHPFLSTSFRGPTWLTGGATGPEGSLITLLVLIASAAIVIWRYRNGRLLSSS